MRTDSPPLQRKARTSYVRAFLVLSACFLSIVMEQQDGFSTTPHYKH